MEDFRFNDKITIRNKVVKCMRSGGESIDNHFWNILKQSSGFGFKYALCQCEDEYAVLPMSAFNKKDLCRWIRRYTNIEDAILDYSSLTTLSSADKALLMNGR